ncbi:MAG: A/G-specific adenine glycosylase [Clostridia bacterium]
MQSTASELLLAWYDHVKRDLPWRGTRDPYRIWISEIMLQQTRVETVKTYYRNFLTLFPTVSALALAPQEQVLKVWEGLGYYSRARNLQKAAQMIMELHDGQFPKGYAEIEKLSGIGPYTAGAIASIAFETRVPAIDGNVYRVASRFFGVREDIGSPSAQRKLRQLVFQSLPQERIGDYNQALMELGATHCSPAAPACDLCPWNALCDACMEGDAASLPIHEKKRPPKRIDVAVCLLTYEKQVLVMKRSLRMLNGLFVFDLLEDETSPARAQEQLREQGFDCHFAKDLGTARHVFTHRVWEMRLFHFTLQTPPAQSSLTALQAHMANADELTALPMPTAVKVAREQALQLIG